jgi:hypothetical protein
MDGWGKLCRARIEIIRFEPSLAGRFRASGVGSGKGKARDEDGF